jgi:hypothetical protein
MMDRVCFFERNQNEPQSVFFEKYVQLISVFEVLRFEDLVLLERYLALVQNNSKGRHQWREIVLVCVAIDRTLKRPVFRFRSE